MFDIFEHVSSFLYLTLFNYDDKKAGMFRLSKTQ